MTGTLAYILSKRIALGAVSGIANITFSGNQLIFTFNDGSHASMGIPLPKDGVSITNVVINNKGHLICTLSDGSTVDAGELPSGTGGGVTLVPKFDDLTYPGKNDTLYLTLDTESLYYFDDKSNLYRPIITNGVKDENLTSVDQKIATIEFNGVDDTFNLPKDDTLMNVFVNGVLFTENFDYTIDRSVSPNTITFVDIWEEEDTCILTWIEGKIDAGSTAPTEGGNASFVFMSESLITEDPWPALLDIHGYDLLNADMQTKIDADLKEQVSLIFINKRQEVEKDDGSKVSYPYKATGIAQVVFYDRDADLFTVMLSKFGEGGGTGDLATKDDIDKLFDNEEGKLDPEKSGLATKADIDKLFAGTEVTVPDGSSVLAEKADIDNLF